MRRAVILWLAVEISSLSSCSEEKIDDQGCEGSVEFPNPRLEMMIRSALDQPDGGIAGSDLADMTFFGALGWEEDQISSLEGLQCMTGLKVLCLRTVTAEDFEPIGELANLEELYIRATSVPPSLDLNRDVSPIGRLTNLIVLRLSDDDLHDLGPLGYLTNLKILELENDSVTDLSPLADLSQLETFRCYYCDSVADLSPFAQLAALKTFELDSRDLTELDPINALAGLVTLKVRAREVSDISALENLTNLKTLVIEHSSASDIGSLRNLSGLVYLTLNFNEIVDIEPLAGLVNLAILDLSSNSIGDIQPLVENPGIGLGDVVYLDNNNLDCEDSDTLDNLANLEARGVEVHYNCY